MKTVLSFKIPLPFRFLVIYAHINVSCLWCTLYLSFRRYNSLCKQTNIQYVPDKSTALNNYHPACPYQRYHIYSWRLNTIINTSYFPIMTSFSTLVALCSILLLKVFFNRQFFSFSFSLFCLFSPCFSNFISVLVVICCFLLYCKYLWKDVLSLFVPLRHKFNILCNCVCMSFILIFHTS